ncbi:hypothetical protein LIER_26102 [Lithospermum erythrorhizon]|uniref:Uncharacterized protein n=1 Tax=Lithospermum erythrorhizon TaxID=34254 RepID=A0AAV3R783_LITER
MVASIETPTPNNIEYEGGRYDDDGALHVEAVMSVKGYQGGWRVRSSSGAATYRSRSLTNRRLFQVKLGEDPNFAEKKSPSG